MGYDLNRQDAKDAKINILFIYNEHFQGKKSPRLAYDDNVATITFLAYLAPRM